MVQHHSSINILRHKCFPRDLSWLACRTLRESSNQQVLTLNEIQLLLISAPCDRWSSSSPLSLSIFQRHPGSCCLLTFSSVMICKHIFCIGAKRLNCSNEMIRLFVTKANLMNPVLVGWTSGYNVTVPCCTAAFNPNIFTSIGSLFQRIHPMQCERGSFNRNIYMFRSEMKLQNRPFPSEV